MAEEGGTVLYRIDYDSLALLRSDSREGSFPNVFPAAASALTRETKPPGDVGVVNLGTPVTNSSLAEFTGAWWRLSFPLNIGNLGDLSGNAGFAVTVALCWRGNSFYAGIMPPGGVMGEGLTMSGVLGFTAKTMTLAPEDCGEGEPAAYNLCFTGIALKLLKLALPPSGGVSLVIRGSRNGISWKAIYVKT